MFVWVGDTLFYMPGDGVGVEATEEDFDSLEGYLDTEWGVASRSRKRLKRWFRDSGATGVYKGKWFTLWRGPVRMPNGKWHTKERAHVLGVKKTRAEMLALYIQFKEAVDHAEKRSCWIV